MKNVYPRSAVGAFIIAMVLAVFYPSSFGQSQAADTSSNAGFYDGLKIMANSVTDGTNWSMVGGYGHSMKGKNNLAFADVAYDFNGGAVGVVVGYDVLWTKGARQFNSVKGGVTLQTDIYPLKFTGIDALASVKATPFVGDLLATPKNGAGIGNIVTAGINFEVFAFSKYSLDSGFQYESRAGQGRWNGNYPAVHGALTRRF